MKEVAVAAVSGVVKKEEGCVATTGNVTVKKEVETPVSGEDAKNEEALFGLCWLCFC